MGGETASRGPAWGLRAVILQPIKGSSPDSHSFRPTTLSTIQDEMTEVVLSKIILVVFSFFLLNVSFNLY